MLDNYFSNKPIDALLSEPDTLAVLAFRQESEDNAVPVKLSTITSVEDTSEPVVEVWKADSPIINSGIDGSCRWRCSESYLFVAIDLHCGPSDDIEIITEQAYQSVLKTIKQSDYQELLRFWNIIPRINIGDGDEETYKRFCNGRLNAFNQFNIVASEYSAASAVGHYGNGITVYAITSKLKPRHIGNPRQVNAFEYPREYGPSSPSFARATSLIIPDEKQTQLFFISGTASIVGHETVCIDDLTGQLNTTNENLQYLLKEAGLEDGDVRSLRVYLRSPDDAKITRAIVTSWYPAAEIVITHSDICRANLLVEVECFCVLDKAQPRQTTS